MTIRKCVVHGNEVTGLFYLCPSCLDTFCTECTRNVIIPESRCFMCGAPLEGSTDELKLLGLPVPKTHVTTFTKELWNFLHEMQLPDEIVDEVNHELTWIEPCNRVKYLQATFGAL